MYLTIPSTKARPSRKVDDARPAAGQRIVMLIADHDTHAGLQVWARSLGFDLGTKWGGQRCDPSEFDFHVTLLATSNVVDLPPTDHMIAPVTVEPAGFAALGPDADTPVLLLESDALDDMREFFLATYDAEPTFAEFKPHVSLSYAWSGEPVLADLPLPDFPLVFDRLVIKPFEPKA